MTTLLIVTGAITLSCIFGYVLLRLSCWAEGREW